MASPAGWYIYLLLISHQRVVETCITLCFVSDSSPLVTTFHSIFAHMGTLAAFFVFKKVLLRV